PAGYDDAEAADEREAEQPPGLSAERLVQQPERPGSAAERTAAAECLGSAGLSVEATEAVVAEDQRPDAVVARAGDPRAIRSGRERDEQRPSSADGDHRGAAREQLSQRRDPPARRDPHPRGRDP